MPINKKKQGVEEKPAARKSTAEEERWADQNPLTEKLPDPKAPQPFMPVEPKIGEEPVEPEAAKKGAAEQERWADQNPWTNQSPKPEDKPVETPKPVKAKPGLIAVRAVESFSDGNLDGFFAQYGYSGLWAANEVRQIPGWLLERCKNSGGEFELENG
jgi:hypothetical protein